MQDRAHLVPFAPGGGYDIYSGLWAGTWVNRQPVVRAENMTGPGGLIGVNHVYKAAHPTASPSALTRLAKLS